MPPAKAIAHRNKLPLLVDTTLFQADPSRTYSLGAFRLSSKLAHPTGIQRSLFRLACSPRRSLRLAAKVMRSSLQIKLVTESQAYQCDPSVRDIRINGTTCLYGYWQSPEYFSDVEELIRSEFSLTEPPSECSAALLKTIVSTNSVALHIRRTDYLTLANSPVLSTAYYDKAVEAVLERVDNPHIFVFSDDIEWATSNLRFPYRQRSLSATGIDRHLKICA